MLETLDTVIAPDGTFEFPRVLAGTYTARFPTLPVVAVNLVVPSGVANSIDIPVPPLKQVSGRVVIEGLSPIAARSGFSWPEQINPLSSGTPFTSTNATAAAARPDGSFTGRGSPEGERKLTLNAPGYSVRSFTYGTMDLLKQPFKSPAANTDEFRHLRRGEALLRDAAVTAVKQWKYKPMVANGQPVRVQTTVTVNFSLQ